MAEEQVTARLEGHVGVVTVNRPPHNYFDGGSVEVLLSAFSAFEADSSCRAIVLRAEGKSFCAGAQFGDDGNGVDADAAMRIYRSAIALFDISKPVVAAIQGAAIGGGLGVSLIADFRIASEQAWFSANFARLGIHAGFGITATLPRVVGLQAASLMLQTGRRVSAEKALEIGLAEKVVPADTLDDEAMALAGEIAANAPIAVQSMRRTLMGDRGALVRAAIEREIAEQRIHFETDDFREGIRAVHERRAPVFSGR
ncbi:enoyl-CoA hydratase/isomerase family protein [Mesorhizobium sp. CAU 1741]|uniref:enoyl-CoA hydratase/isomerase family protein n=1 Tax=Mesorhizobium sp. CAU 1741 TaxID=3140366 RepID=UPI00325BA50A